MFNTKIKHYLTFRRLIATALLSGLCFIGLLHPSWAQTVTEGYGSDQQLQRGMIVQLKKGDTSKVEASSSDSIAQMHGIVVSANDAPVALSSAGSPIYVAVVGHYDVLVSDQGGKINPGDYITISSVNGVGMKAGNTQTVVVGKALASFDGKTSVLSTTDVKDTSGKNVTVNIGRIQADISVGHNPLQKSTEANLPSFLKKAAETIAGKEVSSARIYLSATVFVLSTIVAIILMYGGVKSGLISVGRNPLSKKSIIRSMMQVIVTGFIIFISGLFGVYLLLRL